MAASVTINATVSRKWRWSRTAVFSVALAAAALSGVASAAAHPLVSGTDPGDLADHLFGNHRFGPERPHHFPGGHQRHFGHHHPRHPHQDHDFVRRVGSQLKMDGKEFRFAGTNNYYSAYKSTLMVDDVLGDADDQGFTV